MARARQTRSCPQAGPGKAAMKITCQSCQAKYTIADEKVAGKTVKIKCKKCGATIVVSGSDAAGAAALRVTRGWAGPGSDGHAPLPASAGDDDDGEGATRVFAEGAPTGRPGGVDGERHRRRSAHAHGAADRRSSTSAA